MLPGAVRGWSESARTHVPIAGGGPQQHRDDIVAGRRERRDPLAPLAQLGGEGARELRGDGFGSDVGGGDSAHHGVVRAGRRRLGRVDGHAEQHVGARLEPPTRDGAACTVQPPARGRPLGRLAEGGARAVAAAKQRVARGFDAGGGGRRR